MKQYVLEANWDSSIPEANRYSHKYQKVTDEGMILNDPVLGELSPFSYLKIALNSLDGRSSYSKIESVPFEPDTPDISEVD